MLYDMDIRKVSNDGYLSWDGALYPIAMKYALKDVLVDCEFGKKLRVYDMGGN